MPGGTEVKGANSWMVLAAYLFKNKLGPGRVQPVIRWQQQMFDITRTATFNDRKFLAVKDAWTMDAFINYVFDEHNLRFSLGYQHTRINAKERPQFVNLAVQMKL